MTEVKIATYNTSFASDLGRIVGSEKHFLYRTKQLKNPRQFFENSIKHAIDWCNTNGPTWGAIGFQEMNTPEANPPPNYYNDLKKPNTELGVNYTVQKFIDEVGDNIRAVPGVVELPFGSPTVLTIWNTTVFGELKGSGTSGNTTNNSSKKILQKYVYVSDMETQTIIDEYKDNGKEKLLGINPKPQKGRPILIILTEKNGKNYLLVNLHGPNRQPGNVKLQMKLTKFCIQKHINNALIMFDLKNIPANTFIMGDFNGFFTNEEPFTLSDKTFSAVKDGNQLPLSCCYNFNSSCPVEMRSGAFRELFNSDKGKLKTYNASSVNNLRMRPEITYLFGTKDAIEYKFAKGITNSSYLKKRKINNITPFLEIFINPKGTTEGESEKFDLNRDLFQVSSVDHECVIVRSEDKSRDQSLDGKARDMGDRGKKDYYVLPGDFVLGPEGAVIESAEIVKGKEESDGVSIRSDHEMVCVTFKLVEDTTPQPGGRRGKKNRTKKKRVNTSKKSKRKNLNK